MNDFKVDPKDFGHHLIDATTYDDIEKGHYPMYILGIGVSKGDLTEEELLLLEQAEQ